MYRPTRSRAMFLAAAVIVTLTPLLPIGAIAADFPVEIFKAAAIGAAVSATAPSLNKFVNTLTFQNGLPSRMSTKVVPILSVGEKGYAGAAQVAGPTTYVEQVKAVWAYDDNFSNNEFRIRVLIPSSSLNPLQLQKVQKVGVTAVMDVSLNGSFKNETYSHKMDSADILRAGAIAVAVNAAADPLNKAINMITRGADMNTKVVPIISIGEKAYVGGVQLSGPAADVKKAKAALQYEAAFSTGRYRVKAFVASDSINPLKFGRVNGVGITAIIDTSISDQEQIRQRQPYWRTARYGYRPMDQTMTTVFTQEVETYRHDRGLHKGWYIGKGNQRKAEERRDDRHDDDKREKRENRGRGRHK